ncbi:MAG: metalloregulator ArsR/SmtB family transcription factor [Anaerotignum sp.]|nr:metalloregulator ArsR/SmtB family transcription factor [Anaerotignum sp.]
MIQSYAEYIPVFKAISDETRLRIIDMLSCGEMCACDILEGLSISQSTLSYHMKTLTDSGLVNAERDGAWMRYTLNKVRVDEALSFITSIANEKEDCICSRCKDNVSNK